MQQHHKIALLYESTRLDNTIFLSSIAYAEEDIRWKDADEKMQEQQYEEAAKLYKELSHKSDTVWRGDQFRGVKDMRKIYSIDELELANSQQQNRLLSLALIILPFFIAIAIGCVVYLRKQRRKLIQSQLKLPAGTRGSREIHAK